MEYDDLGTRLSAITGRPFSAYKPKFLSRRVRIRMRTLGVATIDGYLQMVRSDKEEQETLHHILSITVTRFFRDIPFFKALEDEVFPALPYGKIRLASLGCATGEELHSLVMLFLANRQAGKVTGTPEGFGIDLLEENVAYAKHGVYPIEQTRNARTAYFGPYLKVLGDPADPTTMVQVTDEVRRYCEFRPGDVLKDPLPANISLILCRNLLIYIEREDQSRLLLRAIDKLRPGGFLALGMTETIMPDRPLGLEVVSRKHRIYRKPTD